MATPIKRIEKDFLIKVLYDEQIPVMYIKGQTQYVLTIVKPAKGQLFFKSDRPIDGLKVRKKLDLLFDYRGQVIIFSAEVLNYKDDTIVALEPELLYKNLERAFSRVSTPSDLQVQFNFSGDRYSLSYPRIPEYEDVGHAELLKSLDPQNLSALIGQMGSWIKGYASGYKLVIFKDVKPSSTEERVVAETGKAFYIASTQGNLLVEDPYPRKRLITEEILKRHLESTGVGSQFVDDAYTRLIEQKQKMGISSDLWVPLLFQEYVIGYIRLWVDKNDFPPLDFQVIDHVFEFAKVLAYSLKINGYFEAGKLKNEAFKGKIIDISASGLLFAYPNSTFTLTLMPDIELSLRLITERRTINCKAKIIRRYKNTALGYFGCRFFDMEPEDLRFLFEYIYGKTFTDKDANFFIGHV